MRLCHCRYAFNEGIHGMLQQHVDDNVSLILIKYQMNVSEDP